jgi:hypothetical protein
MSSAYVIDETPIARQELASGQYGGHPNAEALIRAHFASISPEVRAGIRLPENADALAAAKEKDAGSQIEVPEGGSLVDWSVRGSDPRHMVLSYVWEDAHGRWHHGVQGYSDDYQGPHETAADKTVRETMEYDARAQAKAAETNVQIEEKLAEIRKELAEQQADTLAQMRDEFADSIKQIVADAKKEGDSGTSSKANRGGSKGTTKKATTAGESGAGDASAAPAPGGSGGSSDDGEAKYPRSHSELDSLANGSGADLPEDWDDYKTDQKVEWLEKKGVKPE